MPSKSQSREIHFYSPCRIARPVNFWLFHAISYAQFVATNTTVASCTNTIQTSKDTQPCCWLLHKIGELGGVLFVLSNTYLLTYLPSSFHSSVFYNLIRSNNDTMLNLNTRVAQRIINYLYSTLLIQLAILIKAESLCKQFSWYYRNQKAKVVVHAYMRPFIFGSFSKNFSEISDDDAQDSIGFYRYFGYGYT